MKQNNVAEQLIIGIITILVIMAIPIITYIKIMEVDEICVQNQTTVAEKKN